MNICNGIGIENACSYVCSMCDVCASIQDTKISSYVEYGIQYIS